MFGRQERSGGQQYDARKKNEEAQAARDAGLKRASEQLYGPHGEIIEARFQAMSERIERLERRINQLSLNQQKY